MTYISRELVENFWEQLNGSKYHPRDGAVLLNHAVYSESILLLLLCILL
jgi:hypothetical protein